MLEVLQFSVFKSPSHSKSCFHGQRCHCLARAFADVPMGSNACLLCAWPKQLMCCKTFTRQSLQKEKQFSSFQPRMGKLCSKHSLSKRSLWTVPEPSLPSSRAISKHQSEVSTTSLLKLLLLALINERVTGPEEAIATKLPFNLMFLVGKENPVFKSLFQGQFLHSCLSQTHRTRLKSSWNTLS